jgi:hypothetical protein
MCRKLKNSILLALVALVLVTAVFAGGCVKEEATAVPPFIPPNYYQALQVEPQALLNTYFTGYGDFTAIEALYNNVIFVFKDVLVDERMFTGLDDGYIWVDMIKCYLTNPEDMSRFKPGDRIDVVGRCGGPTQYVLMEMKFNECLVLPAGSVALPSDPDAGSISPGY